MTSSKERRQKLIELAKSQRATGSSSGTEATAEATSKPISASPLSVAPAEKKRKRLVKAPTTVASTEGESSGSPHVQRRRRGAEVGGSSTLRPEGAEGDASPIPPAQTSPTRPPSPAHLPSPPPASQPLTLPSQTARSEAARSEGISHPSTSPRPQDSAATTEGGGESSLRASGYSIEGLTTVIKLTRQLLQNRELVNWNGNEVDLHLARQLVLSLEFSTQHRRIEKLERKMSELYNQKESLQSDYEALQNTNELLRDMMEEAKREHALQVQETIKTEMMMGDAVAALDAELVETKDKAIQLEAENASLRQQIANLAEALAANEKRAADQRSKLKEAESTIATLTTEKVGLETDKAELEAEKAKLWEEAADTFAEGFDLALEQVKCVFPEADYSKFAIDFEVADGKIIRR
ncbi:uncharacterized protein [Phaseolus vulgaris]|uniref:uncharacterized protein n=1 Tax=Phaseolus vulgaris TaxID=3885 RepID=UPI0035C99F4D